MYNDVVLFGKLNPPGTPTVPALHTPPAFVLSLNVPDIVMLRMSAQIVVSLAASTSGLGNTINPISSIAHKKVYSIPLL